jgi:hypothetical protein
MSLNIINNVLSEEDINYILTLPEVVEAKKCVDLKLNGSVYFSISLTETLKQTIFESFGLSIETAPMRWIKGDTMPHIDNGSKQFEKTHLVYVTDNPGNFLVENISYPITKGCAFIFDEGIKHETFDTGLEPRLLLGPMSEEGFAVGLSLGAPTIIPDPPTNISVIGSVQRISFNDNRSFFGTKAISSTSVGVGAIRGKGSSTRIFNDCRNKNVSFQLCQYRCLGYK